MSTGTPIPYLGGCVEARQVLDVEPDSQIRFHPDFYSRFLGNSTQIDVVLSSNGQIIITPVAKVEES